MTGAQSWRTVAVVWNTDFFGTSDSHSTRHNDLAPAVCIQRDVAARVSETLSTLWMCAGMHNSGMYKEDIVHPKLIHPVQSYIFDLTSR